jgi:hypothetical protein
LLTREASELRLELLSRGEPGSLRLKLRATERRRLTSKSGWLGSHEPCWLGLLHWWLLLTLRELRVLGLLLLLHEWCLAWTATGTTAEEGIRR